MTIKRLILLETLIAAFGAATYLYTTHMPVSEPHWSYSGAGGPEFWGALAPEFSACSGGMNQSPIDLAGAINAELPPLRFEYAPGGRTVVNNGHTVQIDYAPGSTVHVGGHAYELKQLHFHAPGEHTIEGRAYPLEQHLVHSDQEGHLAVVAVLFQEGAANTELQQVWTSLPEHDGEGGELATLLDAGKLLPPGDGYFRYGGSLTTPPCTEGVTWIVMKSLAELSPEQLDAFTGVMHGPNNRPVQPVGARVVVE